MQIFPCSFTEEIAAQSLLYALPEGILPKNECADCYRMDFRLGEDGLVHHKRSEGKWLK